MPFAIFCTIPDRLLSVLRTEQIDCCQSVPIAAGLNLADKEGWIVAENVGSKVAYITLEKVGKWPT